MNYTIHRKTFELRRAATYAALALLTTLGTFSLIANVMPPLMADGPIFASVRASVCLPGETLRADLMELSVI